MSFGGMNLGLPCLDSCKETIDEKIDHHYLKNGNVS